MSFSNLSQLNSYSLIFTTETTTFINPIITIIPTTKETLSFYGQTISDTILLSNIKNPISSQDAATKDYTDNIFNNLSWKEPVYLGSTGDINLSSAPSTIDGITPYTPNTRILVKDQAASSENGIYLWIAAGIAMTRTNDFPSGQNIINYSANVVNIQSGDTQTSTGWIQTETSGVIGTNNNLWTQYNSSGSGGTPAGSNTNIQFKGNTGDFAASSHLSFITSSNTLTLNATTTNIILGSSILNIGINSTTSFIISNSDYFYINNLNASAPIDLFNNSSGNISIGTVNSVIKLSGGIDSTDITNGSLIVDGGVGVNGTISALEFAIMSDVKVKRNINNLDLDIESIKNINTYKYNLCEKPDKIYFGLLAQELENTLLDPIVNKGPIKTINYIELIPILINCIKQLDQRINLIELSQQP